MTGHESSSRVLTNDDFTVGWICALPIEVAASQEMFDDEHDDLQLDLEYDDSNVYSYGRIGKHNVVIAGLPDGTTGTNAAATTATNLIRSFPQIRFGLMVGVGGGAPSLGSETREDVRLGDVVVSYPRGNEGGVIQYDFGKSTRDGHFIRTGHLDKPPSVLRKAVGHLRSRHERQESQILTFLQKILHNTRMREKYRYPGLEHDRLFRATSTHSGANDTCANCDVGQIIQRIPREGSEPVIHYGLIGSANRVIRDAVTRDQLRDEMGICCFEMEAAGLMNTFPCLVIRGICDYADTHKNKRWQPYAAAVAAAYAKELLRVIPPARVAQAPTAKTAIADFNRSLSQIKTNIASIESSQSRENRANLFSWLSPTDQQKTLYDRLRERQAGTGRWFLQHSAFRQWMAGDHRVLKCPGIPGAGKTMMASIVVDHLMGMRQNAPIPTQKHEEAVAFFYCSYTRSPPDTVDGVLASLLRQLLARLPVLPSSIQDNFNRHCQGEKPHLSYQETLDELSSLITRFPHVFIVIDALDEFDASHDQLLEEIIQLQEVHDIRLLITFRPETRINPKCSGPVLKIHAQEEDVRQYLDKKISLLPRIVLRDLQLQQEIKNRITELVDGMFLLARLHVEALMDKLTLRHIRDYLASMKKGWEGLQDAYKATVYRITEQADGYAFLARKVLFWVLHATRPLTINELRHALAVVIGSRELDEESLYEPDDLVSSCAGLVTADADSTIRLVHYTAEEYFQSSVAREFWQQPVDIVGTCLTYLSFDVFDQGCCATDEMLDERLEKYPFLSYAAKSWGKHLSSRAHSQTFDLALKFLGDQSKTSSAGQVLDNAQASWYDQRPARNMCGIHLAAYFGLEEAVGILLKHFHADTRDSNGRTPLSYAAEQGHDAVVKLLLNSDADPNSKSTVDVTPLVYGCEEKHVPVVRLLITGGAEVNYTYPFGCSSRRTPLSRAAEQGYCEVVQVLLDDVAEVDLSDDDGHTPLVRAIEAGHNDVFELLLDRRAEVNYLYTLFRHTATRNVKNGPVQHSFGSLASQTKDLGSRELSNLMFEGVDLFEGLDLAERFDQLKRKNLFEGTDLSHQQDGGSDTTPEKGAGKCEEYTEEDRSAVQAAGSVEDETNSWEVTKEVKRTPLSRAAEKGNAQMIEALLRRGARPDLGDEEDLTPLFYAVRSGHEAAVKVLLSQKAGPSTMEGQCKAFDAAVEYLEMAAMDLNLNLSETGTRLAADPACAEMEPKMIAIYAAIIECLLSFGFGHSLPRRCGQEALILASCHGIVSLVNYLLTMGVNPNCLHKEGYTALSSSANNGHDNVVNLLLKAGADPNLLDSKGRSPLMISAARGHEAIILSLLDGGAWLGVRCEKVTALGYAVMHGKANVVDLLCSRQLDLDSQQTDRHVSPLTIAVTNGHDEVVRVLLRHRADPNYDQGDGSCTPLAAAVVKESLAMMRLLLENGAKPDYYNSACLPPIVHAVGTGNEAMVHLLLQFSADPDCKSRAGVGTPLVYATTQDNASMVKILLDNGADPNQGGGKPLEHPLALAVVGEHDDIARILLESSTKLTRENICYPLLFAAQLGRDTLVQLLLEKGADPNFRDDAGDSPLAATALEGNEATANLLLATGADPNWGDCKPLMLAARQGHIGLVKLLLDWNAYPDVPDCNGRRPLFWAAARGHSVIVELFCTKAVDLNAKDRFGRTALMAAAAGRHIGPVRTLLTTNGIDRHVQDCFSRTALSCAERVGSHRIILLLQGTADSRQDEQDEDDLVVVRQPAGSSRRFCNICVKYVPDDEPCYYCAICEDGGFDICLNCTQVGASCLNSGHRPVERVLSRKRKRSNSRSTITTYSS